MNKIELQELINSWKVGVGTLLKFRDSFSADDDMWVIANSRMNQLQECITEVEKILNEAAVKNFV